MHTVTCTLQGRLGNCFYQIANCLAYAFKYGTKYYIPTIAPHNHDGLNPFKIENTGEPLSMRTPQFGERHIALHRGGTKVNQGIYRRILQYENDLNFIGYFQSFKYFDDYRKQILEAFNLPIGYFEDVVSIHVRRGDFLKLKGFDVLTFSYYAKCIEHFRELGYKVFYIYSDDMQYCKAMFSNEAFSDCEFLFIEGNTDLEDLCSMASCAHNIVANSSFSFVAAWLNQNPKKMVLCPDESYCWYNDNYIPEYFTIVKA